MVSSPVTNGISPYSSPNIERMVIAFATLLRVGADV